MLDANRTVLMNKMYQCVVLYIFLNKEILFLWMFQGSLGVGKEDSAFSAQITTATQVPHTSSFKEVSNGGREYVSL